MLKKIKINRTWAVLGVALSIGGASAFLASRYLTQQMEAIDAKDKNRAMVRIVVPIEDLPKGTKITEQNIAVREVPKEWAHSASVMEAQFDRVENGVLNSPAIRGEPIIWAQLEGLKAPSFSAHLAPGRRAITVPVDDISSMSGLLEPGDVIDIVCYVRKDSKLVMFNVLQRVTVLAAGTRISQKSQEDGKEQTFSTVTLDTSPEDAHKVIAAREVGKITAMLRAPGDEAQVSMASREAMELLGLSARTKGGPSVQIIYGGSGNKLTDVGISATQSANGGNTDAASKLNDLPAALGALGVR